jgi:transcriptional regulator with XRE-family HTH domain
VSGDTFGGRLRRLRLERDLSQRELALAVIVAGGGREKKTISASYLSRLEQNTRGPSVWVIRALAAALDVSPAYLETGSERNMEAELAALRQRVGELERALAEAVKTLTRTARTVEQAKTAGE